MTLRSLRSVAYRSSRAIRHGWSASMARRSAVLLILALLAVPVVATDRAPAAEQGTVEIVTRSGVRSFSVELVATDEERAKGLMDRKEVPEGYGMLFDFKQVQLVTMWMKNT